MHSTSGEPGEVTLIQAKDAALKQLDAATRASARHAVIVLRDEDKAAARAQFRTPAGLLGARGQGAGVPARGAAGHGLGPACGLCRGLRRRHRAGPQRDELDYRRAKDKSDKSLELYKFYVNALYVAMTRAVESLTIVESDTGHPLLRPARPAGSARPAPRAAQASTKEEWAQEARKLELQGKQEQARPSARPSCKAKPVPWTPWSSGAHRGAGAQGAGPGQPERKLRQTLLDYALWHGQQRWVERLAATPFLPAKGLVDGGSFNMAGSTADLAHVRCPNGSVWKPHTRRTVAASRQRHLQAYAAKNFKDILRLCDVHGVDHLTPVGATPLMLAARAGNLPLVQALLAKGADAGTARRVRAHGLAARGEPGDGGVGLRRDGPAGAVRRAGAGGAGRADRRAAGAHRTSPGRVLGADADAGRAEDAVVAVRAARPMRPGSTAKDSSPSNCTWCSSGLPPHLWSDKRRKRSYVNQVLARAEVGSSYRPARQLLARARHGYYLPNPAMLMRQGEGWWPCTTRSGWIGSIEAAATRARIAHGRRQRCAVE